MEYAIVVDGYRFSKDYASYLRAKNILSIYIQSTKEPVTQMQATSTWDKEDFALSLIFDGNFAHLHQQLSPYKINYVIAGSEAGVELADILADYYQVPNNGMAKSQARRNKYLMSEVLRENGVATIKQLKSNNSEDILQWAKENNTWPVVLKPLKGAGTEDVYICNSPEKLKKRCQTIFETANLFGETNNELLVQEFLRGTEYVVNTVSCDGKHFISDIWKCSKRYIEHLDAVIYDREMLLPYEGEIQQSLIIYIKTVLDALDFRYGAGHAEVMMTAKGPILIEIGARVGGHVNVPAHNLGLNHNQLEWIVDAFTDPDAFSKKASKPYSIKKNISIIILASSQEGKIKKIPLLKMINTLPSLYSVSMVVEPGDYLKITKDLFSSPGKVMLIHQDPKIVESDYQKIMDNEAQGFIVEE